MTKLTCAEALESLYDHSWDTLFDEMYWERNFDSELCFVILKREAREHKIELTDVDTCDYDELFFNTYNNCEKGLS